jgi:hypothetical protein
MSSTWILQLWWLSICRPRNSVVFTSVSTGVAQSVKWWAMGWAAGVQLYVSWDSLVRIVTACCKAVKVWMWEMTWVPQAVHWLAVGWTTCVQLWEVSWDISVTRVAGYGTDNQSSIIRGGPVYHSFASWLAVSCMSGVWLKEMIWGCSFNIKTDYWLDIQGSLLKVRWDCWGSTVTVYWLYNLVAIRRGKPGASASIVTCCWQDDQGLIKRVGPGWFNESSDWLVVRQTKFN